MIVFWGFILIAVALLDRVHQGFAEECVERHRFRLYALRDTLREEVIKGEQAPNNWVYEYLDSSIAKTIAVLPTLTIWALLAVALMHRRDDRIMRTAWHLDQELSKPKNAFLRRMYDCYVEAVGEALIDRHICLRILIQGLIASGRVLRWWRKALKLSTEAPETSTLPEFAEA